jgi:diguanylate cyclase (GGDEF)-like protein
MHSIVQVIGLSEALDRNMLVYGVPSFSSWYGIIHIESMLYFIGSTLFLVTMLKERSEIRHEIASLTDPLTGLPNRRAFFHHGHRVLERCRRSKAPCTFLVLDLDRFKAINDTHGHAMGDRVLQVFAAVIPQQLRSSDIIGRLGGEEFAVILPRTHLREAAEIGEQLRAAFREAALMVDGIEIRATLSGGIAVAFGEAQTVADVLERADAALYRAKLNGRDRIESDAGPRNIHIVKKVS